MTSDFHWHARCWANQFRLIPCQFLPINLLCIFFLVYYLHLFASICHPPCLPSMLLDNHLLSALWILPLSDHVPHTPQRFSAAVPGGSHDRAPRSIHPPRCCTRSFCDAEPESASCNILTTSGAAAPWVCDEPTELWIMHEPAEAEVLTWMGFRSYQVYHQSQKTSVWPPW